MRMLFGSKPSRVSEGGSPPGLSLTTSRGISATNHDSGSTGGGSASSTAYALKLSSRIGSPPATNRTLLRSLPVDAGETAVGQVVLVDEHGEVLPVAPAPPEVVVRVQAQ